MYTDIGDKYVCHRLPRPVRSREGGADLFRTEHGSPNDRQQKAIVRDDRRNPVDASAGTGKALTLRTTLKEGATYPVTDPGIED